MSRVVKGGVNYLRVICRAYHNNLVQLVLTERLAKSRGMIVSVINKVN